MDVLVDNGHGCLSVRTMLPMSVLQSFCVIAAMVLTASPLSFTPSSLQEVPCLSLSAVQQCDCLSPLKNGLCHISNLALGNPLIT